MLIKHKNNQIKILIKIAIMNSIYLLQLSDNLLLTKFISSKIKIILCLPEFKNYSDLTKAIELAFNEVFLKSMSN